MNTVTVNNNILQDDNLINLIKSNFNKDDMQLFELNYKFYITNKNNPNEFIVNLEEIFKWIGFSTKGNAKTLLTKETSGFKINIDYKIKIHEKQVFLPMQKNLGGRNSDTILLTLNCFKLLSFIAGTEKSRKIYHYYMKMEDVITKYIENKHNEIITENNNNKQLLELKDRETNQLLQNQEIEDNKKILELKDQEMENNKKLLDDTLIKLQLKDLEIESFKNRKYEEIEKDKHVYIFSCDKPNIFKIGKSKDVLQRKKQLQTANVDNIIILYDRPTSNDYLLELVVHYVLDSYRCKSNGEHFTANLEYTKIVIDLAEVFLDTLKSTFEYITKEELLQKINENIINQLNNSLQIVEPIKKLIKKEKNIKQDTSLLEVSKITTSDNINNYDNSKKTSAISTLKNKDIINNSSKDTLVISINQDIINSDSKDTLVISELSNKDIMNILSTTSEHEYNVENYIINWFNLNYQLTNNKMDILHLCTFKTPIYK